jgi:hypothetical protein
MHSGNVGLSQSLGSLVGAADRLRDEGDIVFAIVGEGAAKAALQTDVRRLGLRNLEFLPTQPYETLSDSLGAADVHVVGLRRGLAGYIVPSKVYGILAPATVRAAGTGRTGPHRRATRCDPCRARRS